MPNQGSGQGARNSFESDGITDPNRPAGQHVSLDAHVSAVVREGRGQDRRLGTEARLVENDHYAPNAGLHESNSDRVAEMEDPADPPVLDESGLGGFDHDVGPKAGGFESAGRNPRSK